MRNNVFIYYQHKEKHIFEKNGGMSTAFKFEFAS